MKNYPLEIIEAKAIQYLIIAFNKYGIEGTEQKIKEVYQGNMQEYALKVYKNLIKGGGLNV